jgi:hypothetical protein
VVRISFEGEYMDTPFQVRKAAPFPGQPYRPQTIFPFIVLSLLRGKKT